MELEEIGARPVSPVRYSLDVGVSGGGIFATGTSQSPHPLEVRGLPGRAWGRVDHRAFRPSRELDGRELVDLAPQIRGRYTSCSAGSSPDVMRMDAKVCAARFSQAPADDLSASRQCAVGRSGQTEETEKIKKINNPDFMGVQNAKPRRCACAPVRPPTAGMLQKLSRCPQCGASVRGRTATPGVWILQGTSGSYRGRRIVPA